MWIVFHRPLPKHYHADLFQLLSEIEDGRTPEYTSVRFRHNEQEFPGYSWRGYGVFSDIQVLWTRKQHIHKFDFTQLYVKSRVSLVL